MGRVGLAELGNGLVRLRLQLDDWKYTQVVNKSQWILINGWNVPTPDNIRYSREIDISDTALVSDKLKHLKKALDLCSKTEIDEIAPPSSEKENNFSENILEENDDEEQLEFDFDDIGPQVENSGFVVIETFNDVGRALRGQSNSDKKALTVIELYHPSDYGVVKNKLVNSNFVLYNDIDAIVRAVDNSLLFARFQCVCADCQECILVCIRKILTLAKINNTRYLEPFIESFNQELTKARGNIR